MRVTLLLCAWLGTCAAFFPSHHPCGDHDTRSHLRQSCRHAVWGLEDVVPPSVTDATTEHHMVHYARAQRHPKIEEAHRVLQECLACTLNGGTDCDAAPADHRPAYKYDEMEEELEVEEGTGLSQNCLDDMEGRRDRKGSLAPLFQRHEVAVAGSWELKPDQMSGLVHGSSLYEREAVDPTPVGAVPTYGVHHRGMTTLEEDTENESALGMGDEYADPSVYGPIEQEEEDDTDQMDPESITDAAEGYQREQDEVAADNYICIEAEHLKTVALQCPPGEVVLDVDYASYGTPMHVRHFTHDKAEEEGVNGNIDNTEEETLPGEDKFIRPGIRQITGLKCELRDYQTRSECTAYDSRDIVRARCLQSNRCALAATGNPLLPNVFERIRCDQKLHLYAKVRCGKPPRPTRGGGMKDGQPGTLLMETELSREVQLDFDNLDQMELQPGVMLMEAPEISRPVVRPQIDPGMQHHPLLTLKATGYTSYVCDQAGQDDDGPIYYWRPNDEDPRLTYMSLYEVAANGSNVEVVRWDQETNTYQATDGCWVKPAAQATGEVGDEVSELSGVARRVMNQPDFLYKLVDESADVTGVLSGMMWVQRYNTLGGVPPSQNGQVLLNTLWWERCTGEQNQAGVAAEVKVTSTYVFYGAQGVTGAPTPGEPVTNPDLTAGAGKDIEEGGGGSSAGIIVLVVVLILLVGAGVGAALWWKLRRPKPEATFRYEGFNEGFKTAPTSGNPALEAQDDDVL